MESKQIQENPLMKKGIIIFTIVVYALVIILHEFKYEGEAPQWIASFPAVNAFLNGTCFVLLISSLLAIKKKNVTLHQKLNTSAMVLSVVFLLCYVVYHFFYPDTSYGGDYKGLYIFILLTHILLAAVSLPFILFAYYRGWIGDVERHRKIVKFTFPIWLYVTMTGVVVYLLLAPYYG